VTKTSINIRCICKRCRVHPTCNDDATILRFARNSGNESVPCVICAITCGVLAYRYRSEQNPRLRIAPAIMLAGAVLAAPPPEYHATETSLESAFFGERIDFTGVVTHTGGATTLVRYAITCCRADATPIVIRLERNVPALHGWMHARGVLVQTANGLRLRADSMNAIAPPADAFVYR